MDDLYYGIDPSQLSHHDEGVFSIQVFLALCIGFWILFILFFLLKFHYQQDSEKGESLFKFAVKIPLLWMVIGFVFTVFAVNIFFKEKTYEDPEYAVAVGEKFQFHLIAEIGYRELVVYDPENIDLHVKHIQHHFAQPFLQLLESGDFFERKDAQIKEFYFDKIFVGPFADVGNFGYGLCKYYLGDFDSAAYRFNRIIRMDFPYKNYYLGKILQAEGLADSSEKAFREEIKLNGKKDLAWKEIAYGMYHQHRYDELRSACMDTASSKYVPFMLRRYIGITDNQPVLYFSALFGSLSENMYPAGIIAAIIIALMWAFYLRKLDIFRPANILLSFGIVIAGGIISLLSFPMYDLYDAKGLGMNGSFGNDIFYSVFMIGATEEFIKFLPVIFLLLFTKKIKEPVDLMLFACLSAVGFATMENILYFQETSAPGIYHLRALICVTGHMCDTGIIAFGLILAKYRFKIKGIVLFFPALFIAALLHGFYDFFILSPQIPMGFLISYLIAFLEIPLMKYFFNTALNQSPFFDERKGVETGKLAQYLASGMFIVILFEFIYLADKYDVPFADAQLLQVIIGSGIFMAFVVSQFSDIDVVKGEWGKFSLAFWQIRKNYNKALGLRITIRPMFDGSKVETILPVSGTIIKRVKILDHNKYYLVKLDTFLPLYSRMQRFVLIRPKGKYSIFENGKEAESYFIAMVDPRVLFLKEHNQHFYHFLDWVLVSCHGYVSDEEKHEMERNLYGDLKLDEAQPSHHGGE